MTERRRVPANAHSGFCRHGVLQAWRHFLPHMCLQSYVRNGSLPAPCIMVIVQVAAQHTHLLFLQAARYVCKPAACLCAPPDCLYLNMAPSKRLVFVTRADCRPKVP